MRLYRALMRLYPASFRNEYEAEMCAIFARRLRDAGPAGRVVVWFEAIGDILLNAARVQGEQTWHDARHAVRTLVREPAFSVTAIVVAALGVGATTAAFSITDHVLVRPLPFKDAHRLVRLYQNSTRRGSSTNNLSPANFRDWQRMATGFASMGAFADASVNLVGSGEPQRLTGVGVTAEILPMLGVAPALGRVFETADDRDGAAGTVLLSYALWQGRFGGDPAIIGRTLLLDDERYDVIGVMPRGFHFPRRDVEVWTPMRFGPDDFEDRTDTYIYGLARLADDVSFEEARLQLRLVAARLERDYPKENAYVGAAVLDLRTELSRQSRLLLLALFGASACVLLIACTNLANLLLARGLARRRELAVRAVMGAGRERLVRQMLTESLIVAGCGGAIGIVLAVIATPVAARLVPNTLPITELPVVDLRLLLFAALVTVATGAGFGVLPAWRAGRVDPSALAEGARTGSSRATERLRSTLVVAEVTASVVLLVAAGLLIRALWNVQRVDPGFAPDGVISMRTILPWPKYERMERRAQFYRRVLGDIRNLPGVAAAAYTSYLPLGAMRGGIWGASLDVRQTDRARMRAASVRFVTPGFFRTLRIPLRAGRDVDDRDTLTSPLVAVVSESFVKEHTPGDSPIGRRLFVGSRELIIVGVAGDVRVRGLERASEPQVYFAYAQQPDSSYINYTPKDLIVRSTADPATLLPAVRAIIAKADPQQPISDVRTMSEVVGGETAPRTAQVRVLGAFAALALLLAGIGLHGLLAFSVSSRSREIGVRIALGALPRDIVSMVLRHGLALAGVGAIVGVALAFAAGRSMQGLLAGVSPADVTTLAAAVGLVLLATLLGTVIPARRAMRIDPLDAIRTE